MIFMLALPRSYLLLKSLLGVWSYVSFFCNWATVNVKCVPGHAGLLGIAFAHCQAKVVAIQLAVAMAFRSLPLSETLSTTSPVDATICIFI